MAPQVRLGLDAFIGVIPTTVDVQVVPFYMHIFPTVNLAVHMANQSSSLTLQARTVGFNAKTMGSKIELVLWCRMNGIPCCRMDQKPAGFA